MESTSVNLLRRLREPHADSAWQRFVDLYAPMIFHWGRRQGLSVTDAADLLQDVLVTLVEKLPSFEYDPSQQFRGWLRTITVNRANDFHRRIQLQPRNGFDATFPQVEERETDLFCEVEYRSILVNRALLLLRTEFRETHWQAAWMQLIEGKKAKQVAEQLNVPINVVYLAKSRLLARLRQELEGLLD